MVRHFGFLATAVLATFLSNFTVGSRAQNSSPKTPYRPNGHEATLTGTIKFAGNAPEPWLIDTSADPVCQSYDSTLMTEWVVVRQDRLLNVLVYATSAQLDEYHFEPPSSPAVLTHMNCSYRPRIQGVQVGQPLNIVNADNTHHNTHPTPKYNAEWNRTQAPGASPFTTTFNRPEVAMPIKDNQHPWEKAYVAVFTHPFFAVSDSEGNYRIEGLPPGSYRITVWHETLGQKSIEVSLKSGESKKLNFGYSEDDLKGTWLMQRINQR